VVLLTIFCSVEHSRGTGCTKPRTQLFGMKELMITPYGRQHSVLYMLEKIKA
jgi:hypothetical protein